MYIFDAIIFRLLNVLSQLKLVDLSRCASSPTTFQASAAMTFQAPVAEFTNVQAPVATFFAKRRYVFILIVR